MESASSALPTLSPSELALLSSLHPKTLALALRLNTYIVHMDQTRGYGELRIEWKAGKAGKVHTGHSYLEHDDVTL